jgi:hypothetical protein
MIRGNKDQKFKRKSPLLGLEPAGNREFLRFFLKSSVLTLDVVDVVQPKAFRR